MKVLVIIPAREGSKGLPGKNIKLLDGKPLIHYTIEAAREIFDDEDIYVSTDSEEIKQVSEQAGIKIPYLRPKSLARNISSTQDVILHTLSHYVKLNNEEPDIIVLLQPTSPLRQSSHIKEALQYWRNNIDMVVSVKETNSNPYYVLFEENKNGFLRKSKKGDFTRRQDCPKVWEYNGAIYLINPSSIRATKINNFTKVVKYQMSEIASIDIDSELDFKLAEFITENERVKKNNLK